jgi:cobalamin synthase
METSLFLAKFWGWYLIIFFVILSFNPSRIKQILEFLKDQKFAVLASFLAIIVGLINILLHNIWEASWTIIITLLGWAALTKGLVMFIFPQKAVKSIEYINIKLVQAVYIFLFMCGVYLLNMGYELIPYEGY